MVLTLLGSALLIICCTKLYRGPGQEPFSPRAPHGADPKTVAHESPPEIKIERIARLESPHCLFGCPETVLAGGRGANNRVIEREIYVLSNNPKTKFADWVAYRATKSTLGRSRRSPWTADPQLPSDETLEPEDYQGAHAALGTDRGHQVPLATFSGAAHAEALNYLSNATPQRSELNQRIWNRLEEAVRELVKQPDVQAVYGVTGPLFERKMGALPGADEEHVVPSGYFKILAQSTPDGVRVAAFIMDQKIDGHDSHCTHQVTIRMVEERSGWDFFVDLEDGVEDELERSPGKLAARLGCD